MNSFRSFLRNHLCGPEGKKLYELLSKEGSNLNTEMLGYENQTLRSFYAQSLHNGAQSLHIKYIEIRDKLLSFLPTITAEN